MSGKRVPRRVASGAKNAVAADAAVAVGAAATVPAVAHAVVLLQLLVVVAAVVLWQPLHLLLLFSQSSKATPSAQPVSYRLPVPPPPMSRGQ